MANETRVYSNFLSGTITNNPLLAGGTTLNSAALANLPAVSATEHAVIVLDPLGAGNGPEIVYVTAHTASATSATISRGQEGTTGVQHATGTAWVLGVVKSDINIPALYQTRTAITADRDWTSATPAAIPTNTCTVSFTKRHPGTGLYVTIIIPRIVAITGACSVSCYARISGVNNEVIDFSPLNTSAGQCVSGSRRIDNVAVGAVTVDLYGAVDSNTGRIGSGTTVEMTVMEVL